MSEELDDFTKQFRAAAVEQKSNGLTSLFFRQRAARSGVNEDLGLSLKKSLRDENHQLARHGVRSLLVDEARNALDTTIARQATDGGLGDALDVVAKHLAVALRASLAESFTSLAASRHV